MPTSELNDENCPLPPVCETPEEKAEREAKKEERDKKFRVLLDDLVGKVAEEAKRRSLLLVLLLLTGCSPSDAKPPTQVQVDHVFCQAKLNNWLMRHEELAKPFADRYGSYREYMTEGCVR